MLSVAILPVLLVTATVFGQGRADRLNNYFTGLAGNGQFNGTVLVAEDGKIIYEKSFGYADYSVKKPNTASTSFPVASITKTMTSTAILQLYEKGKLQLTDAFCGLSFIRFLVAEASMSLCFSQMVSSRSW